MSSNLSRTGVFEPLHAAHAIDQVQIAINLAQPLDDAKFKAVREAMQAFVPDLPGLAEIQRVSFGFGQAAGFANVGNVPAVPNGFVMHRVAPNGAVESEVTITPQSITFRTTVYTRWDKVWEQFGKYLKAIIGIYAANAPLLQVVLTYIDKFVWNGLSADCQPKLLLRMGSPYICPHAFEISDMWHVHNGAFIVADSQTKRLMNINIDCLDEQTINNVRRIVGITTTLTDIFNQIGFDEFQLSENDAFEKLQDRLTMLHTKSKELFKDVISDEMCKRIDLS